MESANVPTLVTSALEHLRQHLRQAEKSFELAKAQYESARTTLQSAKQLYELAENSQHAFVGSPAQSQLCQSCQAIPVPAIFKKQPPFKTPRLKVGDLFDVVENQSSCGLCKFLLEVFQLGDPDQSERLHAHLTPRDSAIYFAQDPENNPWFQKAGVRAEMQSAPFVWLQTGPKTLTGQPHLCITFKPWDVSEDKLDEKGDLLYPRQRDALEAFNGSIPYELILSWLKKCQGEHSLCAPDMPASASSAVPIYLIDVKTRHIVSATTSDRYVALSYVWGMGDFNLSPYTVSLRKSGSKSDNRLNSAGAPLSLPDSIPQTIQDALTFAMRIKERFLWVDLFCIDQTNAEEKHTQIDCMDKIYSSSFLTLVALDGVNADWGLPGVSRPLLQTNQPTVSLAQGRLSATYIFSVWDNNGKSIWDTRGWTLQERLLSRRSILFGSSSITMQCNSEFFHDSIPINLGATGVKTWLGDDYFREDGSGINLDEEEWDFKNWDALVSVYSGRQLSYESDALNACRGSLNRITLKTGVEFCFGLPKSDFLRALLWKPHHEHVLQRRRTFPSWSWLGWSGRAECAYWVGDMADYMNDEEEEDNERPSKRRRLLTDRSGPDAAEVVSFPSEEDIIPTLTLKTTTLRFRLKMVRKHGTKLKYIAPGSLQSKMAVGDHWTLLDASGSALRDVAGELPRFEARDHFFRSDAASSEQLQENGCEATAVFIHYWPRLRDSRQDVEDAGRKARADHKSRWVHDMVSALLVVPSPDDQGVHLRLASVLLEASKWYPRHPQMEVMQIV
jgi:hypothetical protein